MISVFALRVVQDLNKPSGKRLSSLIWALRGSPSKLVLKGIEHL